MLNNHVVTSQGATRKTVFTLVLSCLMMLVENIPVNSTIPVGSTATLASTSVTINAELETATAIVTLNYVSIGSAGDSATVVAVRTAGSDPGVTPGFRTPQVSDSYNAVSIVAGDMAGWVDAIPNRVVQGVFYFDLVRPLYAGTYTYTFYFLLQSAASGATPPAPLSFTVNVVGGQPRPESRPESRPTSLTLSKTLGATTQGGDVILGEGSATAVLSLRYLSTSNLDSFAVTAVRTMGSSPGGAIGFRSPAASDSGSALGLVAMSTVAWVDGKLNETATAVFRFDVVQPSNPGTFTYTFYPTYQGGVYPFALPAPVTLTFTVKRQTSMLVDVRGTPERGSWITVTTVTQATGVMEFRENGRVVRGCSSKGIDLNTLEASCTWRPSRHGVSTISLFFDSSDSAWADFRRSINLNVRRRSSR